MACIIFIVLSSAALLGVVWQGGFSSLKFSAMTGTVGICPYGGFRRYSSFVDLIVDFHHLNNITGLLVGITFEVPSL